MSRLNARISKTFSRLQGHCDHTVFMQTLDHLCLCFRGFCLASPVLILWWSVYLSIVVSFIVLWRKKSTCFWSGHNLPALWAGRAVCLCRAGVGTWVQQVLTCNTCLRWGIEVSLHPIADQSSMDFMPHTSPGNYSSSSIPQMLSSFEICYTYSKKKRGEEWAMRFQQCYTLLILCVGCCPTVCRQSWTVNWGLEVKYMPVTNNLGSFPGYSHPPSYFVFMLVWQPSVCAAVYKTTYNASGVGTDWSKCDRDRANNS